MKKISFILVLAAFLFTSCSKDEVPTKTDLKVVFTLNYDGVPLVFNQNQAYGSEFIKMTRFNYFLTNLRLLQGNDTVRLADLSFVDYTLSNNSLGGAEAGLTLTIPTISTGTYNSIEFGVGLPKELNATTPADYPSSNPLSDATYYWAGWNGYIFSKMEGKYDSLATGNFNNGFTFHTGLDENYKIVHLNGPITLDGNKSDNTIHIALDVKKVFVMNGQQLDLELVNQAHGPSNEEVIKALTNNYQSAFSLK
ncbi:MAG: hypothetical protein J5I59_12545 [Saprospiraceae bacterium]|nr:hypothetical protein [Saprospiraceae bacterium]